MARLEASETLVKKQETQHFELNEKYQDLVSYKETLQDQLNQFEFENEQLTKAKSSLTRQISILNTNATNEKFKKDRIIQSFHYKLMETKNEMYKMVGETQKRLQNDLYQGVHDGITKIVKCIDSKYKMKYENTLATHSSLQEAKTKQLQLELADSNQFVEERYKLLNL